MLVTHDEARNKWCPLTLGTSQKNCIGYECMAWRYAVEHEPLTDEEIRNARTAIGVAAALKPMREPRRGYCGMAQR